MGPPGREGLSGLRGESVSHFQSLAGLSDAKRRQTQHSVRQTDRYGRKVALKSFVLSSLPINFLILYFFLLNPRASQVNRGHREKQVSLELQ